VSAIEALEQVLELAGIEPGPAIGDRHVQPVVLDVRLHDDLAIDGRILRRVLEHMRQGDGRELGIDLRFTIGVGFDAQRVAVERMPHVRAGGVDHIGGRHPLLVHADGGGVDARHVEDVLEQPREPVQLGAGGSRLLETVLGR
jgi:hypothetical protein